MREYKPGDHVITNDGRFDVTLTERVPAADRRGYGKAWLHSESGVFSFLGEAQFVHKSEYGDHILEEGAQVTLEYGGAGEVVELYEIDAGIAYYTVNIDGMETVLAQGIDFEPAD